MLCVLVLYAGTKCVVLCALCYVLFALFSVQCSAVCAARFVPCAVCPPPSEHLASKYSSGAAEGPFALFSTLLVSEEHAMWIPLWFLRRAALVGLVSFSFTLPILVCVCVCVRACACVCVRVR